MEIYRFSTWLENASHPSHRFRKRRDLRMLGLGCSARRAVFSLGVPSPLSQSFGSAGMSSTLRGRRVTASTIDDRRKFRRGVMYADFPTLFSVSDCSSVHRGHSSNRFSIPDLIP